MRVTPAGQLSLFAGNAINGAPVRGPALNSPLDGPEGLAVDTAGNLYIGDSVNAVVEKVTPDGQLSIFAGSGARGTAIAGPATSSPLGSVLSALTLDLAGNLYIGDWLNHVIEKVTPTGQLSILSTSTQLLPPNGLVADRNGNVYVSDSTSRIMRVDSAGTVTVAAGNGALGKTQAGLAIGTSLTRPSGLALDSAGNLYAAEVGGLIKITPAGQLSLLAGNGSPGTPTSGQATSSPLNQPSAVAVDQNGNLYIADSGNHLMEKIDPTGHLSVIAGTTSPSRTAPGPATSIYINPYGIAVDASGNVYTLSADSVGQSGTTAWEILKITPAGQLSVLATARTVSAGTGTYGLPSIAVDNAGDVYVSDTISQKIEKITSAGQVTVIAGNGNTGAPTAGPATSSPLGTGHMGLAADSNGDLYIADEANNVVEKVDPSGQLTIVVGHGAPGPAANIFSYAPEALAVDATGNLYVFYQGTSQVFEVSAAGQLSIVAGNGSKGLPIAGSATNSPLGRSPDGIAIDSNGNLYIADGLNNVVEKIAP